MSSYNINDLIVQLIFAQNTQWLVCKEKPRVSKLSFKGQNVSSVWKLSMHHRYILRLKITLSLHAYLVFQHTSPILSLSTFLFQGSSHIKKIWLIRTFSGGGKILYCCLLLHISKNASMTELKSENHVLNCLWPGQLNMKLMWLCSMVFNCRSCQWSVVQAVSQLTAEMYQYFKLFW